WQTMIPRQTYSQLRIFLSSHAQRQSGQTRRVRLRQVESIAGSPSSRYSRPIRDQLHLPLAWVIRRVDVGQAPRTDRVDLNDGLALRPAAVVLALGHDREAAGPERLARALVEAVAHS